MALSEKQITISHSVPALVGLLPTKRQALVSGAGIEAAMVIAKSGLTIREQQAALAVVDLFLQFCHEDPNNQKWSELMEDAIRREEVVQ